MTTDEARCSQCGGTGQIYDEDAGRLRPCSWCGVDALPAPADWFAEGWLEDLLAEGPEERAEFGSRQRHPSNGDRP